ncbi:MAG: DoxX family protein [Flavobacteriales bacterium]
MNSKRNRIIYLISTGLLTLLMGVGSAGNYIFNYDMVSGIFTDLGYPTYMIYPLAMAKILGLIAIWARKSQMLKEWAYAGFFFDLILGFGAHIMIEDGGFAPALIGIVFVFTSYFTEKKLIK